MHVRHTHTHTHIHIHELTPMRANCVPIVHDWRKSCKKAHQCGPYLSVGPRDSLSLSLSIPIYYITESDNRRKQTQKDKKKEAKANKHDFDHVSMVYSSSWPPPSPHPPMHHPLETHYEAVVDEQEQHTWGSTFVSFLTTILLPSLHTS
jgi:hypothetical protein